MARRQGMNIGARILSAGLAGTLGRVGIMLNKPTRGFRVASGLGGLRPDATGNNRIHNISCAPTASRLYYAYELRPFHFGFRDSKEVVNGYRSASGGET